MRSASGDMSSISLASATVATSSSSIGTTSLTRPMSSACAALARLPVKSMAMALRNGTWRCSRRRKFVRSSPASCFDTHANCTESSGIFESNATKNVLP